MVTVLQRRTSPDEACFGAAASTTSYLLVVCVGLGSVAIAYEQGLPAALNEGPKPVGVQIDNELN